MKAIVIFIPILITLDYAKGYKLMKSEKKNALLELISSSIPCRSDPGGYVHVLAHLSYELGMFDLISLTGIKDSHSTLRSTIVRIGI